MDTSLLHRTSPPICCKIGRKNLFALITVISNAKIKKFRPLFQILQFVHILKELRQHRTKTAVDRFSHIHHGSSVQCDRRIEQHCQKIFLEIFDVCAQIAQAVKDKADMLACQLQQAFPHQGHRKQVIP